MQGVVLPDPLVHWTRDSRFGLRSGRRWSRTDCL